MKRSTKIALITSGGDCQGLNAAIRGVGKSLFQRMDNVEIYGMYDGYRGLIEGDYKYMEPQDLSGILTEGGTILGTSRQNYVPGKDIVDDKGNSVIPSMLQTYNRLNLDCLVIMGGNGTQKSAKLIADAGMNVITLPKTIDNDIWGTDTTFGFQSAVDIATNVIDYIHSTASSHSRIFVVELMGRDAGWLTLNAGIGSGADVILIPEIPYDLNKVAELIEERNRQGKRYSIIACAEGAVSVDDIKLDEEASRRKRENSRHSTVSYEIADRLEKLTGKEARVTVPGHYQRGGPPCPYDRVLATQFGVAAADLIINKQYGRMVAVQGGQIVSIPLEDAASKTKFLPVDHPMIQVARKMGISLGD
ncbi:MAG TPA: 6-phosphofructokinase [Ruminococcaceae bacterium]|nr:6-phosphofructokinase [Clostridiales bacterium]MDY4223607.1 ATP-dependent 6-phosphofructokinase [Candidatus Limivicinus sp.]MDY5083808.1 ATP-dependent 6-phosphofructokinase [Candidatus Limivicinus sp.]HBV44690.1 6-phosphofructokinase [Oscillospiraceae bacterium]